MLESGLEGLLGNSAAYDFLESAVAIFDTGGTLRYRNTAFSQFNHGVRDSIDNLNRQKALLDCPQFRSWLLAPVAADHVKHCAKSSSIPPESRSNSPYTQGLFLLPVARPMGYC